MTQMISYTTCQECDYWVIIDDTTTSYKGCGHGSSRYYKGCGHGSSRYYLEPMQGEICSCEFFEKQFINPLNVWRNPCYKCKFYHVFSSICACTNSEYYCRKVTGGMILCRSFLVKFEQNHIPVKFPSRQLLLL